MDRKQKIFKAFIDANEITAVPNWRTHTTEYVGFYAGDRRCTEDDITRSQAYRRFTDGIEGRAPGAVGTLAARNDSTIFDYYTQGSSMRQRLSDDPDKLF